MNTSHPNQRNPTMYTYDPRSSTQYSTPGVFLPSLFISVVWLSRFMAKLRNIFCTSEAWGVFLAKAGCNGNPEAPAAAVLVSLRSSCHVVLKCQTSWMDNGLIQLEDLSQQRSQPQKKQQNWFLVAPGWEGMRWNEGTNRNDTQRKVDESSFPTC